MAGNAPPCKGWGVRKEVTPLSLRPSPQTLPTAKPDTLLTHPLRKQPGSAQGSGRGSGRRQRSAHRPARYSR